MSLSAREYASRVRDPEWERDLVKQLRFVSEEERLQFLMELVLLHPIVALQSARKTLTQNQSLIDLLEKALDVANASGIRYWLECVVPRLGVRKVAAYLRSRAGSKPDGVKNARYWMPLFADLPGYKHEYIDLIDESLAGLEKEVTQQAQSERP